MNFRKCGEPAGARTAGARAMNGPTDSPASPVSAERGPMQWLRPRSEERGGRGHAHVIETVVLLIVGLFLAIAVVNDVGRAVPIGERLNADLETWQAIIGAPFHNPIIEQDIIHYTTRDIVCADTEKRKPFGHPQICLVFTGPVVHHRRTALGGFYLVANGTDVHDPVLDVKRNRYACWGTAVSEQLCGLTSVPPGYPTKPYPSSA